MIKIDFLTGSIAVQPGLAGASEMKNPGHLSGVVSGKHVGHEIPFQGQWNDASGADMIDRVLIKAFGFVFEQVADDSLTDFFLAPCRNVFRAFADQVVS